MTLFPFNIRVYGIFIDRDEVLVSDEFVFGKHLTKFPGGGLEFGEGTADCIRREMLEETGQSFDVLRHFYTTDFFQQSAFHPEHQVISIYYLVTPQSPVQFKTSSKPFDLEEIHGSQSLRWVRLSDFDEDTFTLPIDRHVALLLKSRYQQPPLKT